jgi:hypothetical protein
MARTNLMVITYATKHGTDVLFAKTKHPPIPRQHLMWGNTPDSLPKIDEHILRRLGCDEPDLGWESAYYYEIFDVATLEDQIDFDKFGMKPKKTIELTVEEHEQAFELLSNDGHAVPVQMPPSDPHWSKLVKIDETDYNIQVEIFYNEDHWEARAKLFLTQLNRHRWTGKSLNDDNVNTTQGLSGTDWEFDECVLVIKSTEK